MAMYFSKNSCKILYRPSLATARYVSQKGQVPADGTKRCVEPVDLAYASYECTNISQGPAPLLIMHGLLGSKSNWNSLSKVFHQRTDPQRRIVAVDARNHGDSPHSQFHSYEHLVEDIKHLITTLKISKCSLLGHSMGGRAMMLFALKYPMLVDKLIVADISPVRTSPHLKTMPSLLDALSKVSFPLDVPISTARVTTDQQLLKVVSDKNLRSFLLTNLVQRGDGSYKWRINIPALTTNFNQIAIFPDTKGATYNGPVLFIGGGASDFLKKSDHPEILKIFPSAKFHYIEGAGHWVHSEKPMEFLQVCLEFLNKI